MPNLKLTNLSTYRNYFAWIAASHTEIDGYKWGDADVVRNDNRSGMPARFLWAMPYENVRYVDNGSDNIVKVKEARLAYMLVPDSEVFADENAAYDKAEAVMEQVIARLYKDKRGREINGVWSLIATNVTLWNTAPIEHKIGSTRYIGWEIRISFMDNTGLMYNSANWSDENSPPGEGGGSPGVPDYPWDPAALPGGILVLCGIYDAENDTYPATGGTGISGAIQQGNIFMSNGAGSQEPFDVAGAWLIALADNPGQNPANWKTLYPS